MLSIEYLPIDAVTPYDGNAKEHPPKQVSQIAESIQQFGFADPIAVWGEDNIVIEGHGRLLAAQKLGIETIPVIRLDGLTDEQRRAYTLIHNKLTMNSGFDLEVLRDELKAIELVDMERFDFSIPEISIEISELEEKHDMAKVQTQWNKANILNLEFAQFPGVGTYDIPQIQPVYEVPEVREWISFNYMTGDKEPEGKGVHFFADDYQFERVWNNPAAYLDKLRQYACVASPDFSPFSDMPIILQIYNHYRKHWCAAYWQANGVTVVPTIRASEDPRSREWWLDGEPEGGIVMVSTMWGGAHFTKEKAIINRDEIIQRLHPKKWFVYGKHHHDLFDGMDAEFISSFGERRWGK